MYGGIDLKSELGLGTTTRFWIPFNKPQSTKLGSPLKDARPVPERFHSNRSTPGCLSASQSVNGDLLQNMAPPDHLNSRTGTGLGPMSPERGPEDEPVHREIDRHNIHVLVVEDKYVVFPSRVCSFVVMDQVADLPVTVLSTSRSLSRQSENSGSP